MDWSFYDIKQKQGCSAWCEPMASEAEAEAYAEACAKAWGVDTVVYYPSEDYGVQEEKRYLHV